ncbi:unnamed protein product [Acanthoscelides obtectus]|uniref:Uncharacterized protein n=1 Tax=Acanthoscelides obtectus TaxID=200917 RepID=A0A9P0KCS7_ACAOB|nr:unnamed protein product [Acanthoscelides obtectus]CAK1631078.1 hypothetical protein AOBTE_LOCUS6746 [Acanthoscelides obtectus]
MMCEICLIDAGQYIPKSFYVIDRQGHQSDVVYIRNRRDILEPLIRMRRGSDVGGNGAQASSSAHASASANAGAGGIGAGGEGIPGFPGGFPGPGGFPTGFNGHDYSNPSAFLDQLSSFASNFPGAFGGPGGIGGGQGKSFATSGSFASGGGQGSGSGTGYGTGSEGGVGGHQGHQAGYNGPILFSRFGETEGRGAQVSASAEGPHAAFSSSSTSVDGNGKVKYSVKSGKY